MRSKAAAFIMTAISSLIIAAAAPAMAQGLELRRVFLSQGGVAYYEYAAEVSDAAELTLDVPRDQLDDILKSLVVFDDKGRVGKVSLAGEAPLSEYLRGLPFDEAALQSFPALLASLRGERVTLSGPRQITGRIAAVDEIFSGANGGPARHRLTILTDQGMEQIFLDEAQRVSFADPKLTAAVNAALDAVSDLRRGDSRQLKISHDGRGKRQLRVGYVAAAPLWKTSYRLNLANGTGRLQGWAILENYSGHDWRQVELTLASGNPVTFHQALYRAYFVDRPEVPVELYGRILPQPDRGVMDEAAMAEPAPVLQRSAKGYAGAPAMAEAQRMASTADSATQITFRLDRPVTLAAGQSLMLPIVDQDVPARRVVQIGATREPLAAIALRNDSATALPPGVFTVYEAGAQGVTYLGDARVMEMARGEERLLAFAADSKVKVSERSDVKQDVASASMADGILRMVEVTRHLRAYDISTQKGEGRRVMVDLAVPAHWKLVSPTKGARRTESGWRLEEEVAGGAKRTIEAVFEEERSETFALLDMDASLIARYLRSGALDDEARRALQAIAERKEMVSDATRRLKTIDTGYGDAVAEQERLRESVKSVAEGSDLAKRYMTKLGELEDRLEQLARERQEARQTLNAAEEQLRSFVRGLKIG